MMDSLHQHPYLAALKRCLRVGWAVVLVAIGLWIAACSRSEAPGWLDEIERAHQLADQAGSVEERERARGALERALERKPPQVAREQALRTVRQDIYHRLAELELQDHNPEAALRRVEAGLKLGVEENVFSVNLLISKARALEALDKNDEASKAYYEALKISDALLDRSLGIERDKGGLP